MAKESIFDKKRRVRPPRVHITYEVETGGAMVLKELPFVVGVMSDLSGHQKDKPKLRDRKFSSIDRDNFDDVVKSMKPRLAFRVDNTLQDDDSQMNVELNFSKLDDFSPEAVAKQVPALAKLLEARGKLKDLLSRMEGNDRLEELLGAIIEKKDVQGKLQDVLGTDGAAGDGDGDASKEE